MPTSITVLGTGGTIASTGSEEGASPSKSGETLVSAVPQIKDYADIEVQQVSQRSSFDMDRETIEEIGASAREAAANGADAVAVMHGTDTMEESAYYLDLTLDLDIPVIFTGAQRRPDEISADGPANILTAVRAASNERINSQGGVYIAFDKRLHAARDVTKEHTSDLDAFESPDKGPVAAFTRSDVRIFRQPGSYSAHLDVENPDSEVRMVKSATGVDGKLIDLCLEQETDGIVLEGTGLGNTTTSVGEAVERAVDSGVPVVVTSRCHAGSTAPVYGSGGGGKTLADYGAIHGNDLPSHKARIKLMLAIEETRDPKELKDYFNSY